MKNDVVIIFNMCGISGRDNQNLNGYIAAIDSCLRQDATDQIVLSMCMNSDSLVEQLKQRYQDRVHYNLIKEVVPVNVSFNHSVREHKRRCGQYKSYFYMASDTIFNAPNHLTLLHDLMQSDNYGIVSAQTTIDSGFQEWLGFDYGHLPENKDYIIPVGKACNMHTLLFSNQLADYYGNIIPDIFAAYCTESTYTFLTGAIGLKFVISNNVIMNHYKSYDGASSGFDPKVNNIPWDNLWRSPRSMQEIIADQEGISAGFGYEEIHNVLKHDESQFENYVCKNDRLKLFIKNNLYLKTENLDYDKIKSEWS